MVTPAEITQLVQAAEAGVIAAGGRAGSLNHAGRTAQVIQATIVYAGLKEVADKILDTTVIGGSLDTMIAILGEIKLQLESDRPVQLQPLIDELVLIREAIHRS